MRIIVIRHGCPHLPDYGRIPTSVMPQWLTAYNAAQVEQAPSEHLIASLALDGDDYVVSSHLPRAISSTRFLGIQEPHCVDTLYREAELPLFNWPGLKLTPSAWCVMFRMAWFAGMGQRVEPFSAFKPRVVAAANQLIKLAEQHQCVLFIGHGLFNCFLTKALLAQLWQETTVVQNSTIAQGRYWASTRFTKSV